MALHTKVGDQYFPVEVADPNRLTSYYESFVLIPHLGPALYARLYRRLKRVGKDFLGALILVEELEAFKKSYKEVPPTPYIPDDILLVGHAMSEGAAQSNFKIDEAYVRPNERQPRGLYRALGQIGSPVINASTVANVYTGKDDRMNDYKQILSTMAQPNQVVSAMVAGDLLLQGEHMISEKFLAAEPAQRMEAIAGSFLAAAPEVEVSEPVRSLSESMNQVLVADTPGMENYASSFLDITAVTMANFVDQFEIVWPQDEIDIVNSCEWAFLRSERITIDVDQPRLRGPLSVHSVAPESRLGLTETQARTQTTETRTLTGRREGLRSFSSIQSEVQNRMGILFDYGSNLGQTMSEQGYSQDNLKSEKRARVEAILQDISQQNSTQTLTRQTLSFSEVREYVTEGKDPLHATTEVSFEVFAPVEVSHYLDDVRAVWSPRQPNPFADLRQSLDDYYQEMYQGYIKENYVIDPTEPVPTYESVNRVTRDTAFETSPGTYTKKVTFKLNATEIASGYLFGDDIQLEFKQHCDWYENCYDEDDRWMKVKSTDRHGGNSWVDVTVEYKVNNVTGNDPDRNYVQVSIDKYKATEAYRQELKAFKQAVSKTNPARRNAVKVQARKYAALKREELIRKHERNINDLKDYAFTALIRRMFDNNLGGGQWSYYLGIIRSCIDWNQSRMEPEPCPVSALYAEELSPYHFLNVEAVRFFLPIHVGAEKVFFDTMRKVVDASWRSLFDKVEQYVNGQREKFLELTEAKRRLDRYDSEIVLGRHLEAVLSDKPFAEE